MAYTWHTYDALGDSFELNNFPAVGGKRVYNFARYGIANSSPDFYREKVTKDRVRNPWLA